MARHDLIVIGAGPGGYVAALRAAQLGLKVASVEKEKTLGGTCLRIGCIPSKALLESSFLYEQAAHGLAVHGVETGRRGLDLNTMMKRKDDAVRRLTRGVGRLLSAAGVDRIQGTARLQAPGQVQVQRGAETEELEADHILLATGSEPTSIPNVEIDGEHVVTSTEALAFSEVPKHLVVIGAGAIGLELGSVWRRLGSKVTVLELMDRPLPELDVEVAVEAGKLLEKQGLDLRLGVKVEAVEVMSGRCRVECEGEKPLTCDKVLVAVGRRPYTEGLGLDDADIETDDHGRVDVDDSFATGTDGVYAIGDLVPGPMLAHKASEEGIACVERLVTGHGEVIADAIPNVVYTHPEIASVGRTEEQLRDEDVPYRKGRFPFQANGRALCLGDTAGFVKMLAHAETDRLLGVHAVGPRAGDLVAEAAVALAFGASAEDVGRVPHAHPTLAETFKEAALAVDDRALHLPRRRGSSSPPTTKSL
jgi:dihydrolipoamide dehydrogenase